MSELQKEPKYNLAAFLSLAAGVLINLSGTIFSFWHTALFPHVDIMMGEAMHGGSVFHAIALRIVLGSIVIIAAILMFIRVQQIQLWGVIILVFSVISFIGMGTFLIGAAFGIVGGALAILKKQ